MRIKKLSAGDIIEAACTRCRAILNHTIVAMVEDRVVRVECNTCHGVHNYRAKTEKKTPAASTAVREKQAVSRQPKNEPAASERDEWEALCSNCAIDQAIPYDMNGKFRTNDLLNHPTFGLGIVKNIIPPNKMEVLFQQGKKLLRCQ
jgi:Zn ribbon nucleic-acid-binding protein